MHLDPGFIGSLVGFILMLIGGSPDAGNLASGRPSPGQSGAHDSEFMYGGPGNNFNGPAEEWGEETEDNNEFHRDYVDNDIG